MRVLNFAVKTWKVFGFVADDEDGNSVQALSLVCKALLHFGMPLYNLSCLWFFVDIYVYDNPMEIEEFLYVVMQEVGAVCYLGTLIDFLLQKGVLREFVDEMQMIVDESEEKTLSPLQYFT